MYFPIHLILSVISVQGVASSRAEVPMLRRSGGDDSNSGSRTLFEEFAAFFYEEMDSTDESAPAQRSAFSDRLEMLSNFTFSSDLSAALGDTMASYYYMEWFLTGDDLGCTAVASPYVKLQCSNGGRIHVDRPCFVQGLDTVICLQGNVEAFDYTSDYFGAWCSGTDMSELAVTVELGASDATCSSASGEAAHGISLGQACGPFGSDDFALSVEEEFCQNPSQYLSAETVDDNPRCMAIAQASQDNLLVSLPSVIATASTASPSCIYAINA